MPTFRKAIYAAGGFTTPFIGPGRPEFDPKKGFKPFEEYLLETSQGTLNLLGKPSFEEGIIGSFMSGRFIHQANLPGFLPFIIPSLKGKSCVAVEGACGTGGKAIATAAKALLSDLADSVFVIAFEMQNRVKPLYGADILAGAAHYDKMRKTGHAHFFPGLFDKRAEAYFKAFGKDKTRETFARWYEKAILTARKNPKSQEYFNKHPDPFQLAMGPPNPELFLPNLTPYDCSKVTDGAASIALFTKEGLEKNHIPLSQAVEIIAIGEAEGDITLPPDDLLELSISKMAIEKAYKQAGFSVKDLSLFEVHDCFSISGILSLEALGLAKTGESSDLDLKNLPVNSSGGLIGFGHPTGASGVRQLVDLQMQLTGSHPNQLQLKTPYGLLVSMGGDDKTVSCIIAKKQS